MVSPANRYFRPMSGVLESGIVKLFGKVVTSTSGTVSSTSCKGFSIAKTSAKTGRYTVTLENLYKGLKSVNVMIVGSTDAAYTSAKGIVSFLRNVAVDSTGTFDIQFADADGSAADAELEDAAQFYVEITLKNSSLTY